MVLDKTAVWSFEMCLPEEKKMLCMWHTGLCLDTSRDSLLLTLEQPPEWF